MDMYTIYETAKIFGVHWQTIRNWIIDGKINAIKVGRAYRIEQTEIDRLKKEASTLWMQRNK